MGEVTSFQRARKPEEQQQRRAAILAAAAELFDAAGPQGTGLSAIAAKAGFTKSNVYRYFESREEVLLNLFISELQDFATAIEVGLANLPEGDIDAIASVSAAEFTARPRLGLLMSIVSGVLEQNVSEASIIALKRGVSAIYTRLAVALHDRLPGTMLADCAWVGAMTGTLVAGMWPNVMSSPAAEKVLAMPEFKHLKPAPQHDIQRAMKALLVSITSRA